MKGKKFLDQRYRETLLKEKRLKEMGYIVITKWSCEFLTDLIQDDSLKKFVKFLNIQKLINLRDCYFGGRTNALVLHKKFTNGGKGHYVDFTSLYPDILKYKRFPEGHPTRIVNKFLGMSTEKCDGNCMHATCDGEHLKLPYFGLMKAKFIPPVNLRHPILPVRCNSKLKFPLCYKCASEENTEQCKCFMSDRSFTYTYCTPEIEVAINMGYIIEEICDVLHWPETEMYSPETKQGALFTKYINTFLKLNKLVVFPLKYKLVKNKTNIFKDILNMKEFY